MKEQYQLGRLAMWLCFALFAYWATLGYLACVNGASDDYLEGYLRGKIHGMENK